MNDPQQPNPAGHGDQPPVVIAAAERAILDSAVGLARKWWPDVEGNWVEEGYSVPAEEYLRWLSCRELQRLGTYGQVHLLPSAPVITVVAPNRAGLLSLVTGTLAVHGLGVRSAAVASGERDMAIAVIELETGDQDSVDWDHVHASLLMVLDGQLCLETRLAQLIADSATAHLPVVVGPAATKIFVDNEVAVDTTMIEVRAAAGLGVLYRITKALADQGLAVSTAKVSTTQGVAVDSFFVTDATGSKITDPVAIRDIERAIRKELAGVRLPLHHV